MILSTALAFAAFAQAAPEMRLLRYPAIHGDNVVFTYASDLWLASTEGGIARRLTSHPGDEQQAKISPDGSMIAFTGMYDGNPDVYVIPSIGGEPKRLTFNPEVDLVVGWTPSGKIAFTSSSGNTFGNLPRLWYLDPKGGFPEKTPVMEARSATFSPDGKKVAYHRMPAHAMNWRRYRGGMQGRISLYDFSKNVYTELPSDRENSFFPMWVGDSIYYVSDKDFGTVNLFRYDFSSKRAKRLTDYRDADIRYPSTDGKRIVWERDGLLYAFDVSGEKAALLAPQVVGDNLAARPVLRKLGGQIGYVTASPSGSRVVVEARGELFSVPFKTGDTRNMTQSSGSRERFPEWSPDGKTIAYVSDAGGDYQIFTQPQLGGTATKLTEHKGSSINSIAWSPDSKTISFTTLSNDLMLLDVLTRKVTKVATGASQPITSYDWSQDSKWIAFTDAVANLNSAVFLYEVASGKTTQITDGAYSDGPVSFDMTGKYLYFESAREVQPNVPSSELNLDSSAMRQRIYFVTLAKATTNPLAAPNDEEPGEAKPEEKKPAAAPTMVVDLDGLGNRILPLPMPAVGLGGYPFIAGVEDGVLYYSTGSLSKFDLKSRESSVVFAGPIQAASFTPKRNKMAYWAAGTLGVVDLRPGSKLGDGKVDTNDVEAMVSPRDEWRQIYWDAWRFQRDKFYDPAFTGVDWDAAGKQYAKYLPYLSHRSDLSYVLGMMVGELGTSHAYIQGGDFGVPLQAVPIGALGAEYSLDAGNVRFARIYRGANWDEGARAPLSEPGIEVAEGDYLLSIDGKEVTSVMPPGALLLNKAGKFVTIVVNSRPSKEGARTYRVRPTGSEAALRNVEWVEGNRRKVDQLSGGKIGYMYVPNTSSAGAIGFVQGYYRNADKDALLVDERFNGGGNIPTFFVEKLERTYLSYFRQRDGHDVGFPIQSVDGPKAMLINGYAGSGGDMLPWLFKLRGVGPLIGSRTWGGLVGINNGLQLVDGGSVTAPEFGLYDPKTGKFVAENVGIEPDIEVDATPDLISTGHDPQLEKGVEWLLKEMQKRGTRKVNRPEFPRIKP